MPYFAEPDDKGWGKEHDYLINAAHARGLPGVICPLEGAWATTGINYPTVDVALIDSRVGDGEAKLSFVFAPPGEFEGGSTEPLVELEARCNAALANPPGREVCPVCGRLLITKPKAVILDAASYDMALPLQRIVEMPTYLVVNDDLGEFIRARGFTNIRLTKIELK